MVTFGWITQWWPIFTWFPIKTLGCMTVSFPISAVCDIFSDAFTNGLKWWVILLKSLKGSSEIKRLLPSGQSTFLLIKMVVAAEFKAFS